MFVNRLDRWDGLARLDRATSVALLAFYRFSPCPMTPAPTHLLPPPLLLSMLTRPPSCRAAAFSISTLFAHSATSAHMPPSCRTVGELSLAPYLPVPRCLWPPECGDVEQLPVSPRASPPSLPPCSLILVCCNLHASGYKDDGVSSAR